MENTWKPLFGILGFRAVSMPSDCLAGGESKGNGKSYGIWGFIRASSRL